MREKLLNPELVAKAVAKVNQRVREKAGKAQDRAPALRDQATRLEREIANLVEALASARGSPALHAALADREQKLAEVKAQLDALAQPTRGAALPVMTEDDVRRRLDNLWKEIKGADRDRARLALERIFDAVTVEPLDGEWGNGWALRLKARPWAVLLPKGGQVVTEVGCGGQDLNLRPSGYEAPDEGLQAASEPINPAESLDSPSGLAPPPMQTASSEHKNFGQPVVSAPWAGEDRLLTPAQAAAQFQVPEYLLRKACAQGRIEHRRVVNALWLAPGAVAAFARSWHAKKRENS